MEQQIGTDEAGYGPNLGPLTICGTSWQVPDGDVDLYEELDCVSSSVLDEDRLTIADSKSVYKSKGSLASLETTVLAILCVIHGRMADSIHCLSKQLSCEFDFNSHQMLSTCASRVTLPVAASRSKIEHLAATFEMECERRGIHIGQIRCHAVFPAQFNDFVKHQGNKSDLLSSSTLWIVNHLLSQTSSSVRIVCDKHGGRSRYLGLINQYITEEFVTIDCESLPLSRYVWRENTRRHDLSFLAKGESFLPTALASMVAKYVREIAMNVWNDFWMIQIPGIKPTRGYPVDARRFKRDIEQVQQRLGITDELIWRNS